MYLSLQDYQPKASRYSNRLAYLKNRVNTNQKHTIFLQKNKKKRTQAKKNHQTTEGKTKGMEKNYKINWRLKMAIDIHT